MNKRVSVNYDEDTFVDLFDEAFWFGNQIGMKLTIAEAIKLYLFKKDFEWGKGISQAMWQTQRWGFRALFPCPNDVKEDENGLIQCDSCPQFKDKTCQYDYDEGIWQCYPEDFMGYLITYGKKEEIDKERWTILLANENEYVRECAKIILRETNEETFQSNKGI